MTVVAQLAFDQEPKVIYCIPTKIRDEQIRLNLERAVPRLEPGHPQQSEPAAIACFGPSLRRTWPRIKRFKHIFTCSGSHRFLLDRGIVPTYHVEVDPRPHKVNLLGTPHPDTTYLIASACHERLFDHLRGSKVVMWHVYDPGDGGRRLLPQGEWSFLGGTDVGLRALVLAATLGYQDLHVFGMDGCLDKRGASHAATHPNAAKRVWTSEYPPSSGVLWKTTPALLAAAKSLPHELAELPTIKTTFYGRSLIQTIARHERVSSRNGALTGTIAIQQVPTISVAYRAANQALHRQVLGYGVGGDKHAATVERLVKKLQCRSVLDYGCGKGYLAKALSFPIWEYDPAIPGKEGVPRPADLVVSTDVLEHVEPSYLDATLADLKRCVKQFGYFVINTEPAKKILPDGRNTHLSLHQPADWLTILGRFFHVAWSRVVGPQLFVLVTRGT